MKTASSFKRRVRKTAVFISSFFIIGLLFRVSEAGVLDPTFSPASTMNTIELTYQALVGTHDSSAVVASKSGDAFQIAKCITRKITGQTPCQ